MKNTTFYFFAFLFIIVSCKQKMKPSTTDVKEKTTSIISDYPCLDQDYLMYKETVIMWEKSWLGFFTNPQEGSSTSPELQFSNDNINTLFKKFIGAESIGVRIYYILFNEKESVPSLAMVNLESCDKDQECDDCVLISNINGDQEFISSEKADTLRGYWEKKSDTYADHTPVYGYNYSIEKIKELMNASESAVSEPSEAAVAIKYGLHTLGPLDTALYTDSNTDKDTIAITGSIVYANIIYANESNSQINNTRSMTQERNVNPEYDFAMPCPAYCSNDTE